MTSIQLQSDWDPRVVAQLYLAAFPDSVSLFFAGKPQDLRVISLVTHGFTLLKRSGCTALVARTSNSEAVGYCIFGREEPFLGTSLLVSPNILANLKTLWAAVTCMQCREAVLLAKNGVRFALTKTGRRPRTAAHSSGRIHSIAVHPAHQGEGIGRRLLANALQILDSEGMRAVYLEVRPENAKARDLYEKHGFSPYGRNQDLQGEWLRLVRLKQTKN